MKRVIPALIIVLGISLSACASKEVPEEAPHESAPDTQSITWVDIEPAKEDEQYVFEPAELTCVLPEEFKPTDYPGEFMLDSYPKDVSSINHVISDGTEDPTLITREEYIKAVEAEYYDAYGEDIPVNVTQYDRIVVDGRPGLWIMYNFDYRGEHFEALMIILYNGNESHYVTFLQGPGQDWMEQFVECAKGFRFRKSELDEED